LSTEGALPADATAWDRPPIRRLMRFFAIVYVVEGLAQTGGLISQPLSYFLKEVHGWTAVQVAGYLTLFHLPWVIKPIYGALSDFVPLFGYRRKSYLIVVNAVAAGAFLWTAVTDQPSQLAVALVLTANAMAISSTLCGALLVENGQKYAASGRFVNQQWLWFNIAAMTASTLGGALIYWLSPASALHAAAFIVAFAPLALMVGTWRLVDEERSAINLPALKETLRGLVAAFRHRELWIVALFIFLYNFSPGLGTPLYYHMTNSLKFSQAYIGVLGSISSAGWVVGALLYPRLFGGLSSRSLLNLSIALGTVSTAAYLLLGNELSAAILGFCSGFSSMVAMVATLTLAADFCPHRSEGFAFAILTSINNLAGALSDNTGSLLYERAFNNTIAPLAVVSSAFTAFAFVFVPMLRLGDKPQGHAVAVVG
jgi:MFS family permease